MDMFDLREAIQDDIITCIVGYSHGGDSIPAEHINDCVSDLCEIVVDKFEEFDNEQKRASKVTDEG